MYAHDTDQLSRLPLFSDVDLRTVQSILADCEERDLPAGHHLIDPNHGNSFAFVLLQGRLTVHLSPEQPPIATLERGECVGEMSFFGSHVASAWVRCAEPSRVLVIDEDSFWALINGSHELAINLLHVLSRRVRSGNTTIGEREERATVDALTGLRNRRWLDEVFARELARADSNGQALCLAMVDVDRFKKFNDEHGHRAGDEVLKGVGRVLRDSSRPNDLAARYGGEEFSVMFPDTPLDDALAAAERLRRAIGACEILHEGAALPRVTASFGLVQRLPGETLEQLVTRADEALYRAKEQGRDRVCS